MAPNQQHDTQTAQPQYDFSLKLVLIGDAGTGKTSLLKRYTGGSFREEVATCGVDFAIRTVREGGKCIKMHVWDTAGQERFSSMNRSYYRGVDGALIVYSVTDRESFLRVPYWVEEVRSQRVQGAPKLQLILIGNKCDEVEQREVDLHEGEELAANCQFSGFFESSARDRFNIDEPFAALLAMALAATGSSQHDPWLQTAHAALDEAKASGDATAVVKAQAVVDVAEANQRRLMREAAAACRISNDQANCTTSCRTCRC